MYLFLAIVVVAICQFIFTKHLRLVMFYGNKTILNQFVNGLYNKLYTYIGGVILICFFITALKSKNSDAIAILIFMYLIIANILMIDMITHTFLNDNDYSGFKIKAPEKPVQSISKHPTIDAMLKAAEPKTNKVITVEGTKYREKLEIYNKSIRAIQAKFKKLKLYYLGSTVLCIITLILAFL
jgi:hypothetical protein